MEINTFIKDIKETIYFKTIVKQLDPLSIFIGGSTSEGLDTDLSDVDIFVILKDEMSFKESQLQKFYNNSLMYYNGREVHFIFKTKNKFIEPKMLCDITGYCKKDIILYGQKLNSSELCKYGSWLLTHDSKWIDMINNIVFKDCRKTPNHYIYSIILLFARTQNIKIDKAELLEFKKRNEITENEKNLFWEFWRRTKKYTSAYNIENLKNKIRSDINV